MRKIDALLSEYGESHQNPTNKNVHWICVPVIAWCVVAILWSLPIPAIFGTSFPVNWMTVTITLAIIYYIILSPRLAVGFVIFMAVCLGLIVFYESNFSLPIWQFALGLFVLAWIGQFWGHHIEGKKPSFMKDIQFLLIGPAWLLSFIYKRLNIGY